MSGLVEHERRRPEFRRDSVPVRMGDGGVWYFPRCRPGPRLRWEDGDAQPRLRHVSPRPDYAELNRMSNAALATPKGPGFLDGAVELVAYTLLLNYHLDFAELEALLSAPTEAEYTAMVLTILEVIAGKPEELATRN